MRRIADSATDDTGVGDEAAVVDNTTGIRDYECYRLTDCETSEIVISIEPAKGLGGSRLRQSATGQGGEKYTVVGKH